MKILFNQANLLRKKEFSIQTIIYKNSKNQIIVRKEITNSEAKNHLEKLLKTHYLLLKSKIPTPKILKKTDTFIEFNYVNNPTIESLVEEKIYSQNYNEIDKLMDLYVNYISLLKEEEVNPYNNKNFINIFDPEAKFKTNKKINCPKLGILDLNFDNLILNEKGKIILIDYEWFFDFPIPKDLIIFRAIIYLCNHLQLMIKNRCSKKLPCIEVFKNFFVPKIIWEKFNFSLDNVKKYFWWEVNFQNYVNTIKQKYSEEIFVSKFEEKKEKLDITILNQFLNISDNQSQINTSNTQNIQFYQNLQQQQIHIQNLEAQLNTIKSSKFFKLWQKYCKIRDKILGKKNE